MSVASTARRASKCDGCSKRAHEPSKRERNMSNKSAKAGGGPHDVVIVGGGSAGIATASSLLKRRPDLDILVIEPQTKHYYQAGLTLVGAGVFRAASTEREASYLAVPAGSRALSRRSRPRPMRSSSTMA